MSETQRIWINGELLSDPEVGAIMPIDHGLVVGDGVFEALKVEQGGPFALTRHLHRLSKSATAMGLPEPSHEECRRGVAAVLADRDWGFGKIRITWTGGKGPLGSGKAFGPGTLIVAAEAVARDSATTRIVTVPWTRNTNGALTGVKTTSYGENVLGIAYATEFDATEGIFENTEGFLAEGTGSNIFVVMDGVLVTPPLSAGILDGVTRRLVIEGWAGAGERPVEVRDLTVPEAKNADEVFITSSTRDVRAVTSWDDVAFRHGEVTKRAAEVFRAGWMDHLDP